MSEMIEILLICIAALTLTHHTISLHTTPYHATL